MARLVHVHAVVALALPAVEAFDLAIPAQVFGDRRQGGRYSFIVCAPAAGLVPSTTGYAIDAAHGLEHLAEPLTIADLARHAGWASRTFARRFMAETGMAPLRWLTAARLHEARRLLEVSDLPVDDIAARSGLGSAANLRLHLARDAGTTPTAYRATYQGRDRHA